jgi:NAD(P)-dependent dehydrogenase (short-subunit alcohol dehydrogenase family)
VSSAPDYSGKVALVTGAGSGIGRATAGAFAAAGASVVLADIDEAGLEVAAKEIEAAGGAATGVRCDVTKGADVAAAVAAAVDTYGGLDAAFNNAGAESSVAGTADVDEDEFDRIHALNVKGVWLSMKYEIPAMIERGGGAIVNASSVMGLRGAAGGLVYCSTKHAVAGMTKCAALDYAEVGIRVNATAPAFIETGMLTRTAENMNLPAEAFQAFQPVGRAGRPSEVADAVLWLCSDASAFITGVVLPFDGGYTAR